MDGREGMILAYRSDICEYVRQHERTEVLLQAFTISGPMSP
jgi:hypothetical protein